jgi:hypothetical protein
MEAETYKTLRDEIAMVALAAYFQCDPTDVWKNVEGDRVKLCQKAYNWADAMLEARDQKQS